MSNWAKVEQKNPLWDKSVKKSPFSEMWALLVLTFAVAVGASEEVKDQTAAEEKLVIARGKLLVSTGVEQEGKH